MLGEGDSACEVVLVLIQRAFAFVDSVFFE